VTEPEAVPPKRVSWAELFFDLVFVFAITQMSALLHADHSLAGVGRALVVFVPVYWMWVGMSVHANTRDVENPLDRLGIFAVALGSLIMALAVPQAYGERAALFASAYLATRIVLLALVLRSRRLFVNPYTIAVFLAGPLRLVGAFLPSYWLVGLWALAAVIEFAAPAVARRRVGARVRYHPAHLPERFGLFLIIALGETIVAIGAPAAAAAHLDGLTLLAVAAAFVLTCGLWWVYFVFSAEAMEHALAADARRVDVIRGVLTYGHFALVAAIVGMAVGLAESVAEPEHHLSVGAAAPLFGGLALYLGTFSYIRRRMGRRWSARRVVEAAVALVLLPLAPLVPALASLCALAVVVTAVGLAEHRLDARAGAVAAEVTPG
jgi:low temperature requirement protein LtrA